MPTKNNRPNEKQINHDLSDKKYILNLEKAIRDLTQYLKTYTDAKSWRAIPKGPITAKKFSNYYDQFHVITTSAPTDPGDFDSPVYQRDRIFEILERYAEKVLVANGGPGIIFITISHSSTTGFSQESRVLSGETKTFYNVYELRARSPIIGTTYRVTEYEIFPSAAEDFRPIEQAVISNQSLPAANDNWLSSDLSIIATSPTTYTIDVAVSIPGIFSAVVTRSGTSVTVNFNNNNPLTANSLNYFHISVHEGDSINFQYSATGGNILFLRVQEISASTAGI